MKLRQIPGDFTVARYAPETNLNPLFTREFCCITRTRNEVTVVCESDLLPAGVQKKEEGWVCLEVEGILDFSLTGILNQITGPLADAEVSLFAISSYDTDYVLVKRAFLEKARSALARAGITIN